MISYKLFLEFNFLQIYFFELANYVNYSLKQKNCEEGTFLLQGNKMVTLKRGKYYIKFYLSNNNVWLMKYAGSKYLVFEK